MFIFYILAMPTPRAAETSTPVVEKVLRLGGRPSLERYLSDKGAESKSASFPQAEILLPVAEADFDVIEVTRVKATVGSVEIWVNLTYTRSEKLSDSLYNRFVLDKVRE